MLGLSDSVEIDSGVLGLGLVLMLEQCQVSVFAQDLLAGKRCLTCIYIYREGGCYSGEAALLAVEIMLGTPHDTLIML